MARNMEKHQEICSGMPEVPITQSIIYEKGRRTSCIRNNSRAMAGNQYQHY